MDGIKVSSLPITVGYQQSIMEMLDRDNMCESFCSSPSDESAETKLMTCCTSICSTTMCYLNVNEAMSINYLAHWLTLLEWATIALLILLLDIFCPKYLLSKGEFWDDALSENYFWLFIKTNDKINERGFVIFFVQKHFYSTIYFIRS